MKTKWHSHPKDCKPGRDESPIRPGEKYRCPGDPLCDYTELARKKWREEAMPAMARVARLVKHNSFGPRTKKQAYWERIYEIVCAAENSEIYEPLEHFAWPDKVEGATELKYVGPP